MVNKRHRIWHNELRERWRDVTISQCEAKFDGCINLYLSPAHSRKRREIETKEQYFEICWACGYCAAYLDEKMSHAEMEIAVKEIIQRRDEYFS